jgi:anaerobic selenocysteine-containing dehydrogenase
VRFQLAEIQYSSCPLNCFDSCGFKVTIENGVVSKVDGDDTHPVTKGKICGRGRMLKDRTISSDRLLYPMKKINGKFERISWEQALTEIADKFSEIKKEYGSQAVLHSHDYANNGLLKNIDKRFFNCYGGVTELYGSLCWGAGIEAQKWDFGDSYSHAPEDIKSSKSIVVWGRNVQRTNMHLFAELQSAIKEGKSIFVIDPIGNATAKIATDFITVKPGMDSFLAAGILKELIRLDQVDKFFIKNYSVGFDDLLGLLNTVSIEELSAKSEVKIEFMTQLAHLYADGPVSTFIGLGMQRYQNGGNTIRFIDALIAASGNVGIAGGGANYGNLQVGQSFDTDKLALPDRKKGSRAFSIMKQAEMTLEASEPPVKMIVVTCGNPLNQVPDTNRVEKAFRSVDTVVVFDQFMTDTAQEADYVLPVTTVFEEEDLYYASMYHHYVNYGKKLVDPPGEAKPDLWIWTELANRLGFGEDFDYTRDEWMNMGIQTLRSKGITLDQIKEERHVELPVSHVPWSDYQFKTPSGKYEFTSASADQAGLNGKISLEEPGEAHQSSKGRRSYPFTLLTIHPLRSNHSQHYHLLGKNKKVKIEISSDIAELQSMIEGDFVRVWNERGEIKGQISIFKQAHPNTINIDEGLWRRFGGSVNALTSSEPSDNKMGSSLYDCAVNIERIENNESAE